MALGTHHVHLKTRDPKQTMQFYVDNLGATLIAEVGTRGYRVNLHGLTLNITTIIDTQRREQHYGLEHIALDTDDYPGTLARRRNNGVRILEELPPTNGRRVGIGVGWNAVEFEALNETFDHRGRRSAEQIAVLRALWTQEVVDFRGEFHRIDHAGLNPMPIQRPIPIWFGVGSRGQPTPPEAALRRIARLADGWSPNFAPDSQGQALVARVHQYAREAGRDPAALPLEGRIRLAGQEPDGWTKQVEAWKALGATFPIAEPRGAGLTFPAGHLDALRRFKATLS